jgi:hypothetical protein
MPTGYNLYERGNPHLARGTNLSTPCQLGIIYMKEEIPTSFFVTCPPLSEIGSEHINFKFKML